MHSVYLNIVITVFFAWAVYALIRGMCNSDYKLNAKMLIQVFIAVVLSTVIAYPILCWLGLEKRLIWLSKLITWFYNEKTYDMIWLILLFVVNIFIVKVELKVIQSLCKKAMRFFEKHKENRIICRIESLKTRIKRSIDELFEEDKGGDF